MPMYFILLSDHLATRKERHDHVIPKRKPELIQVLEGSLWQYTGDCITISDGNGSTRKPTLNADGGVTVHSVTEEHEGAVLQCDFTNLAHLTNHQFDILVAVMTCKERIATYICPERFLQEEKMIPGCCVIYESLHSSVKSSTDMLGMIRYKGKLPGRNGIWFGIELSQPYSGQGDNDGAFGNKRFFLCAPNGGVFTAINRLMLCADVSQYMPPPQLAQDDHANIGSVETTWPLQVGERVVWISEKDKAEIGVTKWIGCLPDKPESGLNVGVEFDNPIGTGSGIYNNKPLFSAKKKHASIIPIDGLIKESEYYACRPSTHTDRVHRNYVSSDTTSASTQRLKPTGRHQSSLPESQSIYDSSVSCANTSSLLRPAFYSAESHRPKDYSGRLCSSYKPHSANFPVLAAGRDDGDDNVTAWRCDPLEFQAPIKGGSLRSIAQSFALSQPVVHDDPVCLGDIHVSTRGSNSDPMDTSRVDFSANHRQTLDSTFCSDGAMHKDTAGPFADLNLMSFHDDSSQRFVDPSLGGSDACGIQSTAEKIIADLSSSVATSRLTASVAAQSGADHAAGHRMADDPSLYADRKPLLWNSEPLATEWLNKTTSNNDSAVSSASPTRCSQATDPASVQHARTQPERISYSHAASMPRDVRVPRSDAVSSPRTVHPEVRSTADEHMSTLTPVSRNRASNAQRDLAYDKPLYVELPPTDVRSTKQKSSSGKSSVNPQSSKSKQNLHVNRSSSNKSQLRSAEHLTYSGEQRLPSDKQRSRSDKQRSMCDEQPSHSDKHQSQTTPLAASTSGSTLTTPMSPRDLGTQLEMNSAVEVIGNPEDCRYGIIRWLGCIGAREQQRSIAGLEMEEECDGYSDGVFGKSRLFTCPPKKAMFVPLSKLQPDSRFLEVNCGLSRRESRVFGSLDCPDVMGYVSPPDPAIYPSPYIGVRRGIQGHHNSCYLDATLFAMFACTTVLDHLLCQPARPTDIIEYGHLQSILRDGIVNPLRSNYFVRADKVLKLRRLLDRLGSVQGLVTEEKDPEEFLSSLLQHGLQAEPFIKLSSGQESFLYQLFVEKKDDRMVLPTTEQLIGLSFLQSNIKLAKVPSCLILQMPRFGKKYRLYNRIIPSLSLDITNILQNEARECMLCGQLARHECPDCYEYSGYGSSMEKIAFCNSCVDKYHGHIKRRGHKPVPLQVSVSAQSMYSGATSLEIARHTLELFAVICIETSHYVAFVKSGRGLDAPWVFFDSMADRMGGVQGYNVPEVHQCPELPGWLYPEKIGKIESIHEDKQLPERMRRLLCDAYICMYQTPDTQ